MEKERHTTTSGEDYLEAILILQKKKGMVRSIDLSRHLGVSKPSVSHAVTVLRKGGFLTMDEDYYLHLTDIGREVAEKIYERHQFFTEQLIRKPLNRKPAGWNIPLAWSRLNVSRRLNVSSKIEKTDCPHETDKSDNGRDNSLSLFYKLGSLFDSLLKRSASTIAFIALRSRSLQVLMRRRR